MNAVSINYKDISMSHNAVTEAYGLFMISWSVLETTIEAAIMKQLQLDSQRTLIITTSMQFRQRVNILCSLLELNDPNNENYKDAIKLLKKIERDAKRNMLVHGHIIVGVPGELTFVKSNIVDGYNANRATFNQRQLLEHITRITNKTDQLSGLLGVTDVDMQNLANVGINASSPTP